MAICNGLSVDVEEYFQVEAAAGIIPPAAWERWPSRVEPATYRLLEILAQGGCRATFFALGWVAERHRALVRAMVEAGHEVACHGYAHQHLRRLSPEGFRADVHRARLLLEDITGQPVIGYRAPTFSICADTLWALDVLVAEGFQYDSSVFPVRHDRYGVPSAPRWPYVIQRPSGPIVELPPLTARVGTRWGIVSPLNLPMAGGGYLRLLPAGAILWAVRRMNREGRAAVVYLHPWEIDPGQPRVPMSRLNRWRHRVGLGRTAAKLQHLLRAARFAPLGALAQQVLAAEGWSRRKGLP